MKKSNDITVMSQLPETLDVDGCIITIDLMGTQTEIASKIIENKAD